MSNRALNKRCLRVNICGAPSSRKSTVCAGLESKLKQEGILAETSKEYARHYINTYGLPQELYEQMIITENQEIRDNAIASVNYVMLGDNPAMASYIFGKRMLLDCMKRQGFIDFSSRAYKFLEEMHMKALKKCYWYDLIVVFPPSDPVIQDGTRTETMDEKLSIYKAIVGFLDSESIPYIVVDGTVDEKIEKCFELITGRL